MLQYRSLPFVNVKRQMCNDSGNVRLICMMFLVFVYRNPQL